MEMLKFLLASRYVTDWTGLHRRDVAVGLVVLNALISILTNEGIVTAFPHLAALQGTLLGLSTVVGAGGVLDKAYANPVAK